MHYIYYDTAFFLKIKLLESIELTLKAWNKYNKYNLNFTHLKLCLATATHNFKRVKITHIWLPWDQPLANRDSQRPISFPIAMILSTINLLTAKLFNFNFYPTKVVSRWRDPQLQVSENYSNFTKWRSTNF